MKKFLALMFGISMMSFATLDIDKDTIIDTKWSLRDQNDAVAIYFKHDYTFWHYSFSHGNRNVVDSNMVCNWQLLNDRIYLSCVIPTLDTAYNRSYQVLFCNDDKLVLRSIIDNTCLEYSKLK